MEETNNIIEEVTVEECQSRKLSILITDEDKFGTDIMKMSNFFDKYIAELKNDLDKYLVDEFINEIPIGDIGIIEDVVTCGKAIIKGKYSYIPDFDRLPVDIKEKLKQGIYHLGDSRQDEGNVRAVIIDENNRRVKDVTLRKVKNSQKTMDTVSSLTNQLQMRQIYDKLNVIEAMQEYQIARDRDRDIKTPFISARQYILFAQETENKDDQKKYLDKAFEKLTDAISGIYTDIDTSLKALEKLTDRLIFRNPKQIRTYMEYIREDLQISTRFIGVQMKIADYQGNSKAAYSILYNHKYMLANFIDKKIGSKGYTAAMIMQMNYPYTDENRDYWYNFSKDIRPMIAVTN